MHKLKNTYIDKMINNKLSGKEIDFLLYIATGQNEFGRVESVYYKDVCSAIDISFQKFYDILQSLSEKGMIIYEKLHRADVTVTLIGNSFYGVDYKKNKLGYLNVAKTNFKNPEWRELKAGSKLLYLYTQRFIEGKHMLVQNFYEEFCKLFDVAKKSLQLYIHELKKKKLLFISKKRNKTYKYEMTMKRSTVLHTKGLVEREKESYIQNIILAIRRNFKKYLPEKEPDKVLNDIGNLADTKRAEKHTNFAFLIVKAVEDSIRLQKEEKKNKPVLNAALVNSCLGKMIEA